MYTQELISEKAVVHIFVLLAWLLPSLGVLLGCILSISKKKTAYLGWGIGLGLVGPLNLLLWRLYNTVLDKLGFDSVKAFFLNIVTFAIIGMLLGFVLVFFLNLKSNKKEAR